MKQQWEPPELEEMPVGHIITAPEMVAEDGSR